MNYADHDEVMREYYNNRASSMAGAYVGETADWVLRMIADMQQALRVRRVLEVACGTGYWTRLAAEAAEYIVGVDLAPNMLALAHQHGLPSEKASFCAGDAYALESVRGSFDGGLAMQWFSHVPYARHAAFLEGWHNRIGVGAAVFMGDNQCWDGMPDKPYAKPGEPDTYELRELPDGSTYEIVKNYFTADELRAIIEPRATDLTIHMDRFWWWLCYTVA